MRVIRKQLKKISPQLYKKLHSLNFRDGGWMQGELSSCRKKGQGVVHYMLDGAKLIGWTLLFRNPGGLYCRFYVRKSERRKGYGRRLLLANIKYIRHLGITFKVGLREDDNKEFFRRVKSSMYNNSSGKRLKLNEFA